MKKEIIIYWPHCDQLIITVELNCRIFSCGIFKSNGEQINQRLIKNICDNLTSNN